MGEFGKDNRIQENGSESPFFWPERNDHPNNVIFLSAVDIMANWKGRRHDDGRTERREG